MEHPPTTPRPALLSAAYEGKLQLLQKIASELDQELGVGLPTIFRNTKDGGGKCALHFAAQGGRLEVLKYLIEEMKLDIDVQENLGETPMCFAALEGHLSIVAYLLEMGANPEIPKATDKLHLNPLHHASMKGHNGVISLLLSRGVNVDVSNGFGTSLQLASINGLHDTVKLLLDHNANPNLVFQEVSTSLQSSVLAKSWRCVKILLKAGADPNGGPVITKPLPIAAKMGLIPIIKLLLKAGADPNVTDMCGLKPIEEGALDGDREVVEILFPVTSPIPSYEDWSIDGVMKHVQSEKFKKMMCNKKTFFEAKSLGTSAFHRKEYSLASSWYTKALEIDPSDAAVLSNRSLCYVYLNQGDCALEDATQCVLARPDWPKAHYRKGVALKLLNRLDDAAEAFFDGLKLDPENKELEAAFREVSSARMQSVTAD